MLEEYVANPLGLYGLLALIPLIILYLLRPKPRRQTVPSLMFLMRDQQHSKYRSLFRIFSRDLLFFLQALAIIVFSLAAAQPYMTGGGLSDTDAIIILDDSASMAAKTGDTSRTVQAKDTALAALGPKNTIILAGPIPQVVLREEDSEAARDFIREWQPSDQPTRLTPALLAVQELAEPGARVVVISDFADFDDTADYRDALQTIKARGYRLEAVQVGSPLDTPENLAIIDLELSEQQVTAFVKNYGTQDRTVDACADDDCTSLTVPAGAIVPYTSSLPPGTTSIGIESDDALDVDDSVTVSTPVTRELSVLVVTNGDYENSFLSHALLAIDQSTPIDLQVEMNLPPKLVDVDHDLVIFQEVAAHSFVTRTSREALERVSSGGAVIIMYQDDVFALGYDDLLPLQYVSSGHATPVRNTQTSPTLSAIQFGSSPTFHTVVPSEEMHILAQADDGTPLIAQYPIGSGRVLWYGLPEEASFSVSPDYPLFWRHAIDSLVGRESLDSLNRLTGDVVTFAVGAKTPSGGVVEGRTILSEAGVYQGSIAVAANLLDPLESSLSVPDLTGGAVKEFLTEPRQTKKDLTSYAIGLALVLLLVELAAVKWRGDA